MNHTITFYCYGHKNVFCTHKTTLEFTTDDFLTLKGDCIIGIKSEMSLLSLPLPLKELINHEHSKIIVRLEVDGLCEEIVGFGSSKLKLTDDRAIIIRKSDYICPRTLMIKANKAAIDISREIVQKMKNPQTKMKVTIQIVSGANSTSIQA